MPNDHQHLSVKLNGTKLDAKYKKRLDEINVDSMMRMPDLCSVRFLDDQQLSLIAGLKDEFQLGTKVEVLVGEDSDGSTIFVGEVTAVETSFGSGGDAILSIQAYDKSHRLHRGKNSRAFTGESDADIIKKMAKEVDIATGTIDAGMVHPFMMQNNQTNMEWILMRAEELDYQVYVDEKEKLHFRPASAKRGTAPTLKWGNDLITFSPRLSAVHQAEGVTVYGWDSVKKENIQLSVKPNKQLTQGKTSDHAQKAIKSFKSAKSAVSIVAVPVANSENAKKMAEGMSDLRQHEFIYAEGVCRGNADVVVGGEVTVNIGSESTDTIFSGSYRVTGVRQVYRSHTGVWETQFTVNGRQPATLNHLLSGSGRIHATGRIYGVVPALVTDIGDDTGESKDLGRVRVKYPLLWDDSGSSNVEVASDWARISSPSAGSQRGFYWLPEIDDEVLVAFEHGDPNRPYIIGSLWNNKDKPPLPNSKAVSEGKVNQRMLKSRSGHVIVLDDSNGKEQIVIRDKSEKNEIVIDTAKNGITIKCTQDITIDAGGNLNIKAGGKVNVEAGADTNFQNNGNFNVKSNAGNKFEGAKFEVKSTGLMKLESNMVASFKGNATKIDGDLAVVVKGGIIKLN